MSQGEAYTTGELLRDWMALAGDLTALNGRMAQLSAWLDGSKLHQLAPDPRQFQRESDPKRSLQAGLALAAFLESEVGAIAREAARASTGASALRERIEVTLSRMIFPSGSG